MSRILIVILESLFTSAVKFVNDIWVWILFGLKMTAKVFQNISENRVLGCMLHLFLPRNPLPQKHDRESERHVRENVLLNCVNILKQMQIYVTQFWPMFFSYREINWEPTPYRSAHLGSHSQGASSLKSLKFPFTVSSTVTKWVYALCLSITIPIPFYYIKHPQSHIAFCMKVTPDTHSCTVPMLKIRRKFWHLMTSTRIKLFIPS
jgi:hypothetical protein